MKRFIYRILYYPVYREDLRVLDSMGAQGFELVSTHTFQSSNQVESFQQVAYVFKKELEDESKDNYPKQ